MSKSYDIPHAAYDAIRDVWAHLTLLATGNAPELSNAEAANLLADAYAELTGDGIAAGVDE